MSAEHVVALDSAYLVNHRFHNGRLGWSIEGVRIDQAVLANLLSDQPIPPARPGSNRYPHGHFHRPRFPLRSTSRVVPNVIVEVRGDI